MSEIAMNAAHMIDMLPDPDKNLAYELIKKLVLAWDPDFTKLTTEEAKQLRKRRTAALWMPKKLTGRRSDTNKPTKKRNCRESSSSF